MDRDGAKSISMRWQRSLSESRWPLGTDMRRINIPLWRDLAFLSLAGLTVLCIAAWPIDQPGTMDSHYYYSGGHSLLEHHAFVEPYIWNYLDAPPSLPAPSHLYWMPLPSVLVAVFQALMGATFRVAQLPFLLLATTLPIVSYMTGWALSRRRRHALVAGGLTILSGFYVPYWTLPETFAPFALMGSLALLSMGQWIERQQPVWLLAAGILTGLGHLCRADGMLLMVVAMVLVLITGWRTTSLRSIALALPLVVGGYLLVMAPWFVRNGQIIGAPLPTAGTTTIFLRNYDELFSYGTPLTLERYVDWGWQNILRSKLVATWTNLQTFVAVNNLVFLTPLTLIGLWQLRRRPLMWPTLFYGFALYGAMTWVFTFPGMRGGLFHSSAALLPTTFGAAMVGLDTAVNWIARRRLNWRPEGAKRFFSISVLLLASGLTAFVYKQQVIGDGTWADPAWNRTDEAMVQVGEWLRTQPEVNPVVMVGNPPAFYYHTGLQAIVVPNENVDRTLAAAQRYNARYLFLDRDYPSPLGDLYHAREQHPSLGLVWDSAHGAPCSVVVYRFLGHEDQ